VLFGGSQGQDPAQLSRLCECRYNDDNFVVWPGGAPPCYTLPATTASFCVVPLGALTNRRILLVLTDGGGLQRSLCLCVSRC
jgi:hypothetical protein